MSADLIQEKNRLAEEMKYMETAPGEDFLPSPRVSATVDISGPGFWNTLLKLHKLDQYHFPVGQVQDIPANGEAMFRKPALRRAST